MKEANYHDLLHQLKQRGVERRSPNQRERNVDQGLPRQRCRSGSFHSQYHQQCWGLFEVLEAYCVGFGLPKLKHVDARPLWEDLRHNKIPLLLVVGEKMLSLKKTARKMFQEANHGARSIDDSKEICEIVEVPNCGHAVHLENPLPLIRAARRFLSKPKGVLIPEPGLLYTDLCQRPSRKDCYKGETSLSKVSDFDFVTL